jgi:elongation factor G
MGELHLEVLMDRMDREFGVKANLGKPQVAYKETILNTAEGEGRYIRQTGGRGQYGHCRIVIEPLKMGEGFQFVDVVSGGVIPKEFIRSVEKGIKEAMEIGILAGFPVIDVKARLVDGSSHEVDSSAIAYKIAGSMAFKDAATKADPILLEPIMSLVIVSPEEYVGDIVSDTNSRRGKVEAMDMRGGSRLVKILVPLAEMFGYATTFRTVTQGRGLFSMEFSRYQPVPPQVTEGIVARIEGRIPVHR